MTESGTTVQAWSFSDTHNITSGLDGGGEGHGGEGGDSGDEGGGELHLENRRVSEGGLSEGEREREKERGIREECLCTEKKMGEEGGRGRELSIFRVILQLAGRPPVSFFRTSVLLLGAPHL